MKNNFLSSGVYGCVYHPPYDCQGKPVKDKTFVTKIVKSEFTTRTEYAIGKLLKQDGFITVVKQCPIKPTLLKQSRMRPNCKLLDKDPQLKNKYVLLYSKYIKSTELADYLKEVQSKSFVMKSFFLICKRIDVLIDTGIVHHDMHFGNILYDGSQLYVIDFGLSILQKEFYDGNKPNYPYLKEAIFKYSPAWNFWTLEYHFLCYLIHEGELTKPIIEHTIQYYLSHHKILQMFGKEFMVKYKDTATNYFMKYDGMSKDAAIIDLLKTSTTWDLFKIALHFIDIYNNVQLDIPQFMTLLLIMIHPIPEYRPSQSEMKQFTNILMRSYSIEGDQSHGKFSKELSKNLKKTIIASKDAYVF